MAVGAVSFGIEDPPAAYHMIVSDNCVHTCAWFADQWGAIYTVFTVFRLRGIRRIGLPCRQGVVGVWRACYLAEITKPTIFTPEPA